MFKANASCVLDHFQLSFIVARNVNFLKANYIEIFQILRNLGGPVVSPDVVSSKRANRLSLCELCVVGKDLGCGTGVGDGDVRADGAVAIAGQLGSCSQVSADSRVEGVDLVS